MFISDRILASFFVRLNHSSTFWHIVRHYTCFRFIVIYANVLKRSPLLHLFASYKRSDLILSAVDLDWSVGKGDWLRCGRPGNWFQVFCTIRPVFANGLPSDRDAHISIPVLDRWQLPALSSLPSLPIVKRVSGEMAQIKTETAHKFEHFLNFFLSLRKNIIICTPNQKAILEHCWQKTIWAH